MAQWIEEQSGESAWFMVDPSVHSIFALPKMICHDQPEHTLKVETKRVARREPDSQALLHFHIPEMEKLLRPTQPREVI